jgi:hypothetical protein
MAHKRSEDDNTFMTSRLGGQVYFWKEKITRMRRSRAPHGSSLCRSIAKKCSMDLWWVLYLRGRGEIRILDGCYMRRQKKILMEKPSGSFSILPARGTAGKIKIYALRRLNKIMLMPSAPRAALLGSGTTSHEMDCKPTPSDPGAPIVAA